MKINLSVAWETPRHAGDFRYWCWNTFWIPSLGKWDRCWFAGLQILGLELLVSFYLEPPE